MRDVILASLTPIAVALIATMGALLGNYWLQSRVARRLRDADELKRMLYEFATLVTRYWGGDPGEARRELEAMIISRQFLVHGALRDMTHHSDKLKQWYEDTRKNRLDLMDAASGGGFSVGEWKPDLERIRVVSREVRRIVGGLNTAC